MIRKNASDAKCTPLQDNQAHRALFSLPPLSLSTSTNLSVLEMPVQKPVTGDAEVDAVLWLREVIGTGHVDLIEKAKTAAARLKTPLKELERRYRGYLVRTHPGNLMAALSSFDFANLDGLAGSSIERAKRRHDAHARFGDTIFSDTPAEEFCDETLRSLVGAGGEIDAEDADMMFDAHHEQRPGTLIDCVLELNFWNELYWLRSAVDSNFTDFSPQVYARQDYVFRMLSRIPRRSAEEAAEVYRHLASHDGMDRVHTGAIILNLIGAPEPYKAKQGDAA